MDNRVKICRVKFCPQTVAAAVPLTVFKKYYNIFGNKNQARYVKINSIYILAGYESVGYVSVGYAPVS